MSIVELTDKEGYLGIVSVQQVKKVLCIEVGTIIKCKSNNAWSGTAIDSCSIWNAPERRPRNAGC